MAYTQQLTGWIILEYNVAGTPALPIRDGYLVIQPGPSGRLQTSTEYSSGWAKDEYYYVNPESTVQLEKTAPGGGGLVWGGTSHFRTTYKGERVWESLFIGSEQAYNAAREEGLPEP